MEATLTKKEVEHVLIDAVEEIKRQVKVRNLKPTRDNMQTATIRVEETAELLMVSK